MAEGVNPLGISATKYMRYSKRHYHFRLLLGLQGRYPHLRGKQ